VPGEKRLVRKVESNSFGERAAKQEKKRRACRVRCGEGGKRKRLLLEGKKKCYRFRSKPLPPPGLVKKKRGEGRAGTKKGNTQGTQKSNRKGEGVLRDLKLT